MELELELAIEREVGFYRIIDPGRLDIGIIKINA